MVSSCPGGTEWNDSLYMCRACAHGSYRADGGATQCVRCSHSSTTPYEGAVSVDDCVLLREIYQDTQQYHDTGTMV